MYGVFMKENELVKVILEYLNYKGHFVWRNNTGAVKTFYTDRWGAMKQRFLRFSVKGASDIIGIAKDGRMIAIECKVGKNKPTEDQNNFLSEINKRGGIGIVAYDMSIIENKFR